MFGLFHQNKFMCLAIKKLPMANQAYGLKDWYRQKKSRPQAAQKTITISPNVLIRQLAWSCRCLAG